MLALAVQSGAASTTSKRLESLADPGMGAALVIFANGGCAGRANSGALRTGLRLQCGGHPVYCLKLARQRTNLLIAWQGTQHRREKRRNG